MILIDSFFNMQTEISKIKSKPTILPVTFSTSYKPLTLQLKSNQITILMQ